MKRWPAAALIAGGLGLQCCASCTEGASAPPSGSGAPAPGPSFGPVGSAAMPHDHGAAGAHAGGGGGMTAMGDSPASGDPADGGGTPPTADDVWEPVNTTLGGCAFERLSTLSAPALAWQPCNDVVEGCQVAKLVAAHTGPSFFTGASQVVDAAGGATLSLSLIRNDWKGTSALFLDGDGRILRGVRTSGGDIHCRASNGATSGDAFVLLLSRIAASTEVQSGLQSFASGSLKNGGLGIHQLPWTLPIGPMYTVLGSTRWAWTWPDLEVSTIDPVTGTTLTLGPTGVSYHGVVAVQDKFLLERWAGTTGGAGMDIGITDGLSAPTTYVPAPSDGGIGGPVFARDFVAWREGHGQTDAYAFLTIDLWASPFSMDPTKLSPRRIARLATTSITDWAMGGWSHYVYAGFGHPEFAVESFTVEDWNLSTGTSRRINLPSSVQLHSFLGVTQRYLWLGTTIPNKNEGTSIYRIPLSQ